jgi:hypothetical protein
MIRSLRAVNTINARYEIHSQAGILSYDAGGVREERSPRKRAAASNTAS